MWTPREGATVYWTIPGGNTAASILPTSTFTNTGPAFPNTPVAFWERYANGEAIWIEAPNDDNPAGVRAHLFGEGDHGGVSLGAALMRAASDPGNPWGLEPRQMQGDMQLLIHDFMATELGPGRPDPRVLYPVPASPALPPASSATSARIRQLEAQLARTEELIISLGKDLSVLRARLSFEQAWAARAKSMNGFNRPHGKWWQALKEGVDLVLRPLT